MNSRATLVVGLWLVWPYLGCSGDDAGGNAAPDAAASASSAAGGVPCEVAAIVSEHCAGCHAATPRFTAPMSLMTRSDFRAAARTDRERKVYELVPERINATEPARRMPPVSEPALSAAQLETLDAWVRAGAPASDDDCAITDPGSPSTGGDAGGMQAMPGSGGVHNAPIDYDDPDLECYQFLAHAPGDFMQPFEVPTEPDLYMNFEFPAPWDGMTFARSYASVIDNDGVVHHWLFYKNESGMVGPDGAVETSFGVHPGGQLVNGWAPGGTDTYFDPDVGTEMPSTASYTLEIHYNNTTGAIENDASGIEVCVTPHEPTHVATVSWLGTDAINGTMAQGTCDPVSDERIHIIGATPHMHVKGTRMQVVRTAMDGMTDTLHDMPFDFNYQRGYDIDVWLEPGETITTSCYYAEPARFGEGTGDEMCYWFAMHYPKLALTNNNFIARTIHGPNTCLE